MQTAGGEVDTDGVGGVAGGIAIGILLKKDGLGRANQALQVAPRHIVRHGARLGGPGPA